MSEKLTAFIGLLTTAGMAFFAMFWAIPMLVNLHEDWALMAAALLAGGTVIFVWQSLSAIGPTLGLWVEKGPSDE